MLQTGSICLLEDSFRIIYYEVIDIVVRDYVRNYLLFLLAPRTCRDLCFMHLLLTLFLFEDDLAGTLCLIFEAPRLVVALK